MDAPAGKGRDLMDVEFRGEVWEWRGPAPYYFVSLPEGASLDLADRSAALSYGWGSIKVRAQIDDTEWETSLIRKDGRYVLPLRDSVRKPRGLDAGDAVTVRLSPVRSAVERKRQPPVRQTGRSEPVAPRSRPKGPITEDQLTIVPANEATWEDLRAIFGSSGDPSRCWCQRFSMWPKESWASVGAEGLAARLRTQTACGDPESSATSGLVAYFEGEPVGWCAVEPRSKYPRLLRACRVPWEGRSEDKTDDSIWAVTCFVTRKGFRRLGISRALARTAVDFARQRGARALEGYPDLVEPGNHVGTRSVFADAGFTEVIRPTNRRAVMRIDF